MSRRAAPTLVTSLVLLAIACMDVTSPEQPLVILPANQVLPVPRTITLSTPAGRDTATVTWESNDPTVASVSASGFVTAKFPGSVSITARRRHRSAALMLLVTASTIDVTPNSVDVPLAGVQPLTAIVRDADGAVLNDVPVRWSTGNVSIAIVNDRTGVVTGIGPGSTTITVMGGGVTGGVTVHVSVILGARLAFSSIGVTSNHACGIEARTGLAYCWGDNHAGALGSSADGEFPSLVSSARLFGSISVGSYGTCALERESGFAWCWGSNADGDLGDGSLTTRWGPTLAGGGGIRFSTVSAGGHATCGIEATTRLAYCWGRGGVIGDGTLAQRSTPTLVGSGGQRIRFSSISANEYHACGIEAESGLAFCWGQNNVGQIGDGTAASRLVPTVVGGGNRHFSRIDAGYFITCGIEVQTNLGYCWGRNNAGQLGDGTTIDRLAPTLVGGGAIRFSSIDVGGDVACGIEAQTGNAYCWGNNESGQVGDGTTTRRLVPTLVGGSTRFSSITPASNCCVTYGIEAVTGFGYWWGYGQLVPALLSPPTFDGR